MQSVFSNGLTSKIILALAISSQASSVLAQNSQQSNAENMMSTAQRLPPIANEYFLKMIGLTAEADVEVHFSRKDKIAAFIYKDNPRYIYTSGDSLYDKQFTFVADIIDKERSSGANQKQINKAVETKVIEHNQFVIEKMRSYPFPTLSEKAKAQNLVTGLTHEQILETARSIKNAPFNDIAAQKTEFDAKGAYGFCFGRAQYYFTEAAYKGLHWGSIAKVFVVGRMQPFIEPFNFSQWQFHVAAAVRGVDGEWYALDNHMADFDKKVVTVAQWYAHYRKVLGTDQEFNIQMADKQDADGNWVPQPNGVADAKALMLFFTQPTKVGASGWTMNSEGFVGELTTDKEYASPGDAKFYNGYFQLMTHYYGREINLCNSTRYSPKTGEICDSQEEKTKEFYYNRRRGAWKTLAAELIEFNRQCHAGYPPAHDNGTCNDNPVEKWVQILTDKDN